VTGKLPLPWRGLVSYLYGSQSRYNYIITITRIITLSYFDNIWNAKKFPLLLPPCPQESVIDIDGGVLDIAKLVAATAALTTILLSANTFPLHCASLALILRTPLAESPRYCLIHP
jgi:hypothetical protein